MVSFINLLKRPTETFVVEKAKIYKEEYTEGYIIRDETIINVENSEREIVPIKSEGEKVAKGESVFRYCRDDEQEINVERINPVLKDDGTNNNENNNPKKDEDGGLSWIVILIIILLILILIGVGVFIFIRWRKKGLSSEEIEKTVKQETPMQIIN